MEFRSTYKKGSAREGLESKKLKSVPKDSTRSCGGASSSGGILQIEKTWGRREGDRTEEWSSLNGGGTCGGEKKGISSDQSHVRGCTKKQTREGGGVKKGRGKLTFLKTLSSSNAREQGVGVYKKKLGGRKKKARRKNSPS